MTAKKTSKTTSKNQKNNKSSAEKVTEETTPSRVKRMLRWSFWLFLKMSFIAVFVLFLYSIYLDGKVRDKFEGQRWQVPVQVFGAIEKYTVGSKLTLTNLRASLSANRYKKVTHVERPGEFALSKSRAIIYRRAFDFGAGVEAPAKLTIDVGSGRHHLCWARAVNS